MNIAGLFALAGAWLSGILALLDLILIWEGFTGHTLTTGLASISVLIAGLGLLAAVCGSAGGVLVFMRQRFNFVIVSLDIEFVSGLLSLLISQGFFLQLGLPIILLSQMGLMFTLMRRLEFTAGNVAVSKDL